MSKRSALPAFFHHEAAGGIALVLAAVAALLLANSPWAEPYGHALHVPIQLGIAPLALEKALSHWINDGLMVIFFFVVGLEIKSELVTGALSSVKRAALPLAAAAGGMIIPALIYIFINHDNPVALNGWAIPCATDIAFAVGVVALLGSRVPPALKIFLLALAIIDDLGAILIIAAFYAADLSFTALGLASIGVAGLVALNRNGVMRISPYLAAGFFVWLCVLKSGVHATLAGVITAMAVPLSSGSYDTSDTASPALTLQHALHPWVTFAVLPLFALANAGVSIEGFSLANLADPIPLGIILGLVLGKPIGVVAFSWIAIKSGLADQPEGATWDQILGIGALAGIGFTMSLFIGMLAFPQPEYASDIRLGVLAASCVAGVIGYVILRSTTALPKSN